MKTRETGSYRSRALPVGRFLDDGVIKIEPIYQKNRPVHRKSPKKRPS